MKISVNIKVRNPEWYGFEEEGDDEYNNESLMSREAWEVINDGKIPKYSDTISFEYKFDVIKYSDNRNGIYELEIFTSNDTNFKNPIKNSISIKDITIVEFISDKEKGQVIVSNDLIHQFISARKGKDGRFYWYIYIKENKNYCAISENIWISESHYNKLMNKLMKTYPDTVNFMVKEDQNIKIRSTGGLLPMPLFM